MALIFTPRTDLIARQVTLAAVLGVHLFAVAWYYYALPSYTRVGYMPEQPVPFSHALHIGQLGMHCQYCHTHVAESPHSNVPTSETCMNCHNKQAVTGKIWAGIKPDSPYLSQVQESYARGNPVPWKRIHKVPDYVYFNHAVHVNRGVSCVSCHGQINEMPVVWHAKELSMGWCLNCHRAPSENLRPPSEVYNMTWQPPAGESARKIGESVKDRLQINPPQTCQGCHR